MSAGLLLRDVGIALGSAPLVERLDLAVEPGAVATVMGPSGSGKSTLLAVIAGFADTRAFRVAGRVLLDGADVTALPPERRRIGLLFQDDLLFPHLSVGNNLAFGLDARVCGRGERRRRVERALAEAGLGGFADRDPATLSGGQRARVALLRVLLSEPRALLLDEPFSKLDAALRPQFRALVFGTARASRLPVLQVTHDREDIGPGPLVTIGGGA